MHSDGDQYYFCCFLGSVGDLDHGTEIVTVVVRGHAVVIVTVVITESEVGREIEEVRTGTGEDTTKIAVTDTTDTGYVLPPVTTVMK